MLGFKIFKTEHWGRPRKTPFVHPGMLGGTKNSVGEKKNTPSGDGEGREGDGRGVTFVTKIRAIARN